MKCSYVRFSVLSLAFTLGGLASQVRAEPPPPAPSEKTSPAAVASQTQTKPTFPDLAASPCSRDADCSYNYKYTMRDGRCCAGTCSPQAVTNATAARIEAYCSKAGYDDSNCPTKKCATPPPIRCVHNVCELRK